MTPTPVFARLRRPLALWLALLLALFGALAPVLAQARMPGHGGAPASVLVCSSTGARTLQLAPDEGAAGQPSAPSRAHCLFCLLHADRGALPLHSQVDRFAVLRKDSVPLQRQAFFFWVQTVFSPPPRGPPIFLAT